MARNTANKIGAAREGSARQAAKGIPSGPAVELLECLIEEMMLSRLILLQRLGLIFLVYLSKKRERLIREGENLRFQIFDQKSAVIEDLSVFEIISGLSALRRRLPT